WRRHRHGPPARRDRRDDPGHCAGRAGTTRPCHCAGDAVRRRRHGRGDDHRADLKEGVMLHTDIIEGIATITIDQPDRSMNVLSLALSRALEAEIGRLAAEPSVSGIILTSGKG